MHGQCYIKLWHHHAIFVIHLVSEENEEEDQNKSSGQTTSDLNARLLTTNKKLSYRYTAGREVDFDDI